MLRFCWLDAEEQYDPRVHFRCDEKVYSVKLLHEEGKPAQLDITVTQTPLQDNPVRKRHGALSIQRPGNEIQCLFRGIFTGESHTHNKHFYVLTFTNALKPLDDDWKELLAANPHLLKDPFYNPLFHRDPTSREAVLAGHPLTLYWERTSGQVRLSHAIRGTDSSSHWEIDRMPSYDPQKLSYRFSPPMAEVRVGISAQWVQHISGVMDVAPYIADKFHERMMNTYTGKAFAESWPKKGSFLGHSGYRVLHSQLQQEDTPFQAPLKKFSDVLTIQKRSPDQPDMTPPKKMIVQRSWFQGELLIGWHYRQKRRENLFFTLSASLPKDCSDTVTKEISLPLGKITQMEELPLFCPFSIYKTGSLVHHQGKVFEYTGPENVCPYLDLSLWKEVPEKTEQFISNLQDSFFTTPRGIQAFHHGLEQAKTLLTWGSRSLEIIVKGGPDLSLITPHDTAQIKDSRLPQGLAKGKIVRYCLEADQDEEPSVQITVACPVGVPSEPVPLQDPIPLYADGYATAEAICHQGTPATSNGVTYIRYDHMLPKDLFRYRIYSHVKSMVDKILIKNTPQEQEQAIYESDLFSSVPLKGKETKISLQFQRLQGQESLDHSISVTIPQKWFTH